MERRLAAILAADVAGYTRLMGADEAGTLRRLTALRQQLLEPLIAEHRGRVVKLMGDGLLVEFASVVDALTCAVGWQNGVAEREAEVGDQSRLLFRIGINVGDVIVQGDDIHGDGVNIAARLEGEAEPGGICLSGDAYRQVRGKIDVEFEDLGERQLKNVSDRVHVYRIADDRTGNDAGSAESEPLAPPDKPSIAVLPLDNMSGDIEQEYFSDGITEDIITELSRFRSLVVIARHSCFAFKGQAIDIKEIGRKLGAQYLVEGSVRKAGHRIRVTTQLIEAATGNHIWAERYDRELEDIFVIQDELVRTIVSTVGGRIEAAGKRLADRLKDSSVRAYDLCLRAQALQDRNTQQAYREAERCLRQAIELDPHMAQAYNQFSLVRFWAWMVHWSEESEDAIAEAVELAEKALALDDTDSLVHAHLCLLHFYRREFDKAGYRIEQALRLNPNDAKALGIYGNYLIVVGEPERAIEQIDKLALLNPIEPGWITRLRGIAYMSAGRYEEAVSVLKSLESPINITRIWLASSLANAGRVDEARATLDEFLRVAECEMAVFPGRSLSAWKTDWRAIRYKNQDDADRFFEGLRKAGLVE